MEKYESKKNGSGGPKNKFGAKQDDPNAKMMSIMEKILENQKKNSAGGSAATTTTTNGRFNESSSVCYNCQEVGHWANRCPYPHKKKSKRVKKRAIESSDSD